MRNGRVASSSRWVVVAALSPWLTGCPPDRAPAVAPAPASTAPQPSASSDLAPQPAPTPATDNAPKLGPAQDTDKDPSGKKTAAPGSGDVRNTLPATQPGKPAAPPAATASTTPVTHGRVRTLHPQAGQTDCIEMYGSCTPPPDRTCTSQAFVLECGKSGQTPGSRELLSCVCP